MRKHLRLTVSFLFFALSSIAQEKEVTEFNPNNQYQSEKKQETDKTKQPKKVYTYQRSWSFGGNIGLSFWNGGTDILVAPKAYYNVSPKFLTGFGLTYIYSAAEDDLAKYSQNSFGPSLMIAVRPIPFFQLSAEYEGLQTNGNTTRHTKSNDLIRKNVKPICILP